MRVSQYPTDCLLPGSLWKNGVNHLRGRCEIRTIICTWSVMCLGHQKCRIIVGKVELLVAE
jgi:hypothetical protein